jgi:hypothetical protein
MAPNLYLVFRMREWLLFNASSASFQLYHGENKLIFNEMMDKRTNNDLQNTTQKTKDQACMYGEYHALCKQKTIWFSNFLALSIPDEGYSAQQVFSYIMARTS